MVRLGLFVTVMVLFMESMSPFKPHGGYVSQDNASFARTLADSTVYLIDVRTAEEFSEGHIPGAVNINVSQADFERRIDTLDRNRSVAVYCRGGSRSKIAAMKLSERGFKVYELNHGFMNWDGARTVE